MPPPGGTPTRARCQKDQRTALASPDRGLQVPAEGSVSGDARDGMWQTKRSGVAAADALGGWSLRDVAADRVNEGRAMSRGRCRLRASDQWRAAK